MSVPKTYEYTVRVSVSDHTQEELDRLEAYLKQGDTDFECVYDLVDSWVENMIGNAGDRYYVLNGRDVYLHADHVYSHYSGFECSGNERVTPVP